MNAHYLKAQKVIINGYVTNMQSVMFDSINSNWTNDNLIHNRLKVTWNISENLQFKAEARTRIFTGETVKYTPNYATDIQSDNGLLDLSWNMLHKKSVLINTAIDRLYLSYELNKLNVSVGRQRINWGNCLVWNPNDIFNTYSFFDFDYAEKQGSDAFRLQYYASESGNLDMAAKLDSGNRLTAAALYKQSIKNSDYQLMTGVSNQNHWVAGFGSTHCIKNLSIRTEATYLHPVTNATDTSGLIVAAIGFDYAFNNSAMLQLEFLYNQKPENTNVTSAFNSLFKAPESVADLSFTPYNFFAQFSYPVTEFINASVSGMYYPKLSGFFAGPSVSAQITDAFDFSLSGQTFSGEFTNPLTGNNQRAWLNLIFIRMKYSF